MYKTSQCVLIYHNLRQYNPKDYYTQIGTMKCN